MDRGQRSRFLGGRRRVYRLGYRIRGRRGDLGWFRPRNRRRWLRSGRFDRGGFDFLRGPRCRDGGEFLNDHGFRARC